MPTSTVPTRWSLALTLAVATLYATVSLSRWRQVLNAGYDLGIFDQALRHYAHLLPPCSPLKGYSANLLGDHFHPLLAVLAPLYWIWDDPRVLLVAQALVVACATPYLMRLAGRRMARVQAAAFTAAVMVSWPLQHLIDFDFHEVALAVPLLAAAFDALDRRSDRALVVACVLLLGVREDMGLVVGLLGVCRALRRPRLPGLALAVAGPVVMVVVTRLVVPALAPDGEFAYWDYPALGPGPSQMVRTVIEHPLTAASLLVTPPVKAATLVWLVVPVLGLCLASPWLLPALPLVVGRLWSDRPRLWQLDGHYNAPVLVIVVAAGLHTFGRLSQWLARRHRSERTGPQRATKVATVLGWLLVAAMAGSSVVAPLTVGLQPPFVRLAGPAWRIDTTMRAKMAAVAQIPPNTCVAADDRIVPRLTRTNRVSLPDTPGPTPQYIVIDMSRAVVGDARPSPRTVLQSALAHGYRQVWRRSGIVVLHDPAAPGAGDPRVCGPLAP